MADDALSPVDVYKDQDFYVPSFQLLSGSDELIAGHDVMSISYSDSLTSIDSFDMTVNNWDAEALDFKYSDANTFRPWTDVELRMGYHRDGKDERRTMLLGEITTMAPSFPSSGGPTLSVRGLNLLHRFRTEQKTQTFFDQTDTQIAKTLVGLIDEVVRKRSPGVSLELDPDDIKANAPNEKDKVIHFLIMSNQYPIVFLMERSRRIGYDLSLTEERSGAGKKVVVHFRPGNEVKRRTYALEWGASLISFQPTLRSADQVSKVTVRGWHPGGKEPIEEHATRADLKGEVVDPLDLGVIEPPLAQEISVDRPVSSKVEAKELARKILRQQASELVTAKGKTIGLPDLRAGVKVKISRLGRRFSGTYLVTETTHSIGEGGYTTDFSARMEGAADQS